MGASHAAGAGAGALTIPLLAAPRQQAALPLETPTAGVCSAPPRRALLQHPREGFVAPSSGKQGADPEEPKLYKVRLWKEGIGHRFSMWSP